MKNCENVNQKLKTSVCIYIYIYIYIYYDSNDERSETVFITLL